MQKTLVTLVAAADAHALQCSYKLRTATRKLIQEAEALVAHAGAPQERLAKAIEEAREALDDRPAALSELLGPAKGIPAEGSQG